MTHDFSDTARESQYLAWRDTIGDTPDPEKSYAPDDDGVQERIDDMTYAAWRTAWALAQSASG